MDTGIKTNGEIEEILRQMECKRDFQCYKNGFRDICDIKDIGLPDSVECLSKTSRNCEYSVAFGDSAFCKCPLRVYIAKKFGK